MKCSFKEKDWEKQCTGDNMIYNRCKKHRDAMIFAQIEEWETEIATKMNDFDRKHRIAQLHDEEINFSKKLASTAES